MIGKLDPEERVMKDDFESSRFTEESLIRAYTELGWDMTNDDIHVEIGGTSVYGIDGAGTKWAPLKNTRKYNKDAFIVIKNRSRNPTVPSINDDPERLPHHSKVEASEQQSDSGKPADEHSGAG